MSKKAEPCANSPSSAHPVQNAEGVERSVVDTVASEVVSTSEEVPEVAIVEDEHEDVISSSEDEHEVNIAACEEVTFEMRQDVPGLKYKIGSEEAWTKVKRRKGKRKQNYWGRECSDDSGSKVDIACTREVKYQERGEVPGLYVRKGSTMTSVTWTPVKPSPISSRLRRIDARPNYMGAYRAYRYPISMIFIHSLSHQESSHPHEML